MNRFFKYHWKETRGDEFDDWGFSTYYLETDEVLYPLRQLVVYDNGNILKYDENYFGDEFGMLPDTAVDEEELKETNTLEISKDEFEEKWLNLKTFNRK